MSLSGRVKVVSFKTLFMPGKYSIVRLLTTLSHAPANARPPENYSFGFSYCPGIRRIQFRAGGKMANKMANKPSGNREFQ